MLDAVKIIGETLNNYQISVDKEVAFGEEHSSTPKGLEIWKMVF